MKMRLTGAALALAFVGVGCGDGAPGAPVQPTNPPVTTPTTVTPGVDPGHAQFSGVYDVHSTLNFAQQGALPGDLGTILADLKNAKNKPAATIYRLAVASDKNLKLPSWAESIVLGILDSVIKKSDNPYVQQLNDVAALAQSVADLASSFDVHLSMTIANPDAQGSAQVDEQLADVTFTSGSESVVVDVPAASKPAARASVSSVITPAPEAPAIANGSITIKNASFTVPIGAMLYQAAGPLVIMPLTGKANLGEALQSAVDCAGIGDAVNDQTSIVPASVVAAICRAALGQAALQVENQIKQLALTGITVTNATAKLLDAPAGSSTNDRRADRIDQGIWGWDVPGDKSDGATIAIPAMFTGVRTGK